MSNWFECKVRYDKMMENGATKKVTESYLVDAFTFTDAEKRMNEEMEGRGEFSVTAVKRSNITEIFWDDSEAADKWYHVKVNFITLDEKTAVEKKTTSHILVAAGNFRQALDSFMEGMKGTMADFEVNTIAETPLMDVYKAKVVD